jgi:hypothetical protein
MKRPLQLTTKNVFKRMVEAKRLLEKNARHLIEKEIQDAYTQNMTQHEIELKTMLEDILWMSARYAHGRHTYAPEMVRQVVANMKRLYPDWEPHRDETLEPKEAGSKWTKRDYLDDIFNPKDLL